MYVWSHVGSLRCSSPTRNRVLRYARRPALPLVPCISKGLLHQALIEFSGTARGIDVYHASRIRNPVPADLTHHIIQFVGLSSACRRDAVPILASALEFDANPPGMHSSSSRLPPSSLVLTGLVFRPERAFDHFYESAMSMAEKQLQCNDLTSQVRASFIRMARQRQDSPSARAHLDFLRTHRAMWAYCQTDDTCLVCLTQSPQHTLSCDHRFCSSCVVVCGTMYNPGHFAVDRCPLCMVLNENTLYIRPPTAGVRALRLGGSMQSKFVLFQLLKGLKSALGLAHYPVEKHFDLVTGRDIGWSRPRLSQGGANAWQEPISYRLCSWRAGRSMTASTI